MFNSLSVIQKVQETSSRNDKEAILTKAFQDKNYTLFKLLKYAYDPFITFGVADKMVPASGGGDEELSFEDFETVLKKLQSRTLTGNAAREELQALADRIDSDVWDVICKGVLLKDMRAGFTDNTVNKVLKAISKKDKTAINYIIPSFDCQLAFDGSDEEIVGQRILQIKLDGVRLLTLCDKESGTVVQYTRNGRENVNFPHVKKVFEDLLPSLEKSMVFDGEIMSSSFQDLMTQVSRKDNAAKSDTKLALFDCLPLSDFKKEICNIKQSDRIKTLETIFANNKSEAAYVVPHVVVNVGTVEGDKTFSDFNNKAIEAGFEGIMVKKTDAPYECRRTKSWLKIKPFISVSLPIVAVEEGTGKNTGALGAFKCVGVDYDKEIEVNCGSGFSDEQRKELWVDRDRMIGRMIEIKADVITKEADSDVYSLRFPRFIGFRGSLPGEKI